MLRGWATPCIMTDRGTPTNHHRGIDQVWGKVLTHRVTADDATVMVICVPHRGAVLTELIPWPVACDACATGEAR